MFLVLKELRLECRGGLDCTAKSTAESRWISEAQSRQPEVSKALQVALHFRVPVSQPRLRQDSPARSDPSQTSGPSLTPLPQTGAQPPARSTPAEFCPQLPGCGVSDRTR